MRTLKEKLRMLDQTDVMLEVSEAEIFGLDTADILSIEQILEESEDDYGY